MIRDGVGQSVKRWPDRLEHYVHARGTDHRVDTTKGQLSVLNASQLRNTSPEVDETEDESGDDGKVGEVEAHGRSSGNREGDVVSGADRTVERDGRCDDDVANCAGLGVSFCRASCRNSTAYIAPAASRQLRPSEI